MTLTKQLERLSAALKTLGVDPTTDPDHLERLSLDQGAYLETLSRMTFGEAKQTLFLNRQLGHDGILTQLLAYEPGAYGGKGRAAIAYGDVDNADNVAFCVPGLNSGLHIVNNVAGDAMSLLDQALLADSDRRTAVVAWQGYDAPDYARVLSQDNAERGAKLLAADVSAMRITHDGPIGTLTVVGHSYGSTTTGLDKSQVFVGSASQDIVTTLAESLGADPSADEFGRSVTRFKAESVDRTWPISFSDHSLYFDAVNHSESLYSLAEIITGHGDRLSPDEMLAEPRHTQTSSEFTGLAPDPVIDPESSRTPTAGHDHANDVGTPSP